MDAISPFKSFLKLYINEKTNNFILDCWIFLSAINETVFYYFRGVDVENAIKIAAADDGFVTYDELRENLRK